MATITASMIESALAKHHKCATPDNVRAVNRYLTAALPQLLDSAIERAQLPTNAVDVPLF